jgi:hypothetical protein
MNTNDKTENGFLSLGSQRRLVHGLFSVYIRNGIKFHPRLAFGLLNFEAEKQPASACGFPRFSTLDYGVGIG